MCVACFNYPVCVYVRQVSKNDAELYIHPFQTQNLRPQTFVLVEGDGQGTSGAPVWGNMQFKSEAHYWG